MQVFTCFVAVAEQESQPAQASPDIALKKVALLPWGQIIEDPKSSLTSDDLLKLSVPAEKLRDEMVVSFGFSKNTHWFLLGLNNTKSESVKKLLVFEPTWLDEVEIFLVKPDGSRDIQKGGDTLVFEDRAIHHQNINFALSLPPGLSKLLVRTRTVDPYHVAMTLWDEAAFYQHNNTELLYLGILYGAVIAMLLYNLMLFISVREKVYAAYIVYLLFFLIMHATYNGYLYQLLWPNSPVWSNWAHSVFIYLFVISGLSFAINFLDLRSKHLRSYRVALWTGVAIVASSLITAVVGGYTWHVISSILWVILYAPFVLALGLISLIAGNRAARFFFSAAIAGFIGSFITALAVSGLIEYSYISYHAVDIGMLIDAILLSFALADRLRIAKAQTERAKSRLLDATNRHAKELEKTVAERTLELSKANATKDKFFSIIAHDLRGPIGGMKTLFSDVILTVEDFNADTLEVIRSSTETTNNFLEQLLSWASSQQGKIEINPEEIKLTEIIEEVINLFSTQALNKGIDLQLTTESSCLVLVDLSMLRTILRNLVHNALKFTSRGGAISVSIETKNATCMVRVEDTGVGISEAEQQVLFRLDTVSHTTPGTEDESGSGLGLILCAEFVEKNKGEIGVVSHQGEGSCFWFSLPKVKSSNY